jgi:4-alpha-glucanotransferase
MRLPLIAEDLGVITPEVEALRDAFGLPGMKILQFAFNGDSTNPYLPANIQGPHWVVYTGTHDNNTTLGWWQAESEATRDHVRAYLGRDGNDVVWDLIRVAMLSVATTAIVPFQDVLSLDAGARMNLPGESNGNWSWRVRRDAFHDSLSTRLKNLAVLGDRLPRLQKKTFAKAGLETPDA